MIIPYQGDRECTAPERYLTDKRELICGDDGYLKLPSEANLKEGGKEVPGQIPEEKHNDYYVIKVREWQADTPGNYTERFIVSCARIPRIASTG